MSFPTGSVTVIRRVQGAVDEMGEPTVTEEREVVEGILWNTTNASDLSTTVDAGARPYGTSDIVTVHFPKTYSEPLSNCTLELLGRRWEVVGDPIGYMPDLVLGPWNRAVQARRVEG